MKKFAHLLILLPFLAACNTDEVDPVSFDVAIAGDPQEIYAGQEVVFEFSGRPDYIVFWSGEDGHKYEHRNRLALASIESMTLDYTIKQQYGRADTKDVMHILISTDFSGDYSQQGIEAATWTELSAGENAWPVPVNASETVNGSGDLTAYAQGSFALAFHYQTSQRLTSLVQHPRVDVNLTLNKTSAGQVISASNPQDDFGFQHVRLEGPETKYSVDATTILIQPDNAGVGLSYVDDWCISSIMNPLKVAPDSGDPISSLSTPLTSYTYTFDAPGTYTVSFVARNANAWNQSEIVREITVEVK